MQMFRIPDGPWEKILGGNFQNLQLEIYTNHKDEIFVIIYEKENEKITGCMFEIYKIFYVIGEAETFTETLPREAILIVKRDSKETTKFLMLGSNLTYSVWQEDAFSKEFDNKMKLLNNVANLAKDISKAYDITLKEISTCNEKIREAFFAQPILPSLIIKSYHEERKDQQLEFPKSITKGEIVLGITKDKTQVIEPLILFTKTAITEGSETERRKVMQVLIESCLMSKISTIIFDKSNDFAKLSNASTEIEELTKYKVPIEPMGFPIRVYTPGKDIKISLNNIDIEEFVKVFGFGNNKSSLLIKSIIKVENTDSISKIIKAILQTKESESLSGYEINRSARMLLLISYKYGELFEGSTNIEDMIKVGIKPISTANIINLQGQDDRIILLIINNILTQIKQYIKQYKGIYRGILFYPDAKSFMPNKSKYEIVEKNCDNIVELSQEGFGFCLETDHLIDINSKLKDLIDAKINIVEKNDVGVLLKGRKLYRVFIRPTLSKCE